jgi:multidrug efflux pump subunit AcrB
MNVRFDRAGRMPGREGPPKEIPSMILKQRILLVAVPVLLLAVCGCPRRPDKPLPTVTVTASYPGANAEEVASTVAGPLELEVSSAEGLLYLWSRCTSDGCTLTAVFQPGADLNVSQVIVQNRVAMALPHLPVAVQQAGMPVMKKLPGVLLFVSLFSPGDRYDTLYLSNYAAVHIKDELARLPGVADLVPFGEREVCLRVWLDPDKLAARNLTTTDVIQALREQNVQVQADRLADRERALQLSVATLGRLNEPEKVADIILGADGRGTKVRLKDVARVEAGAGGDSRVRLDGKPSVALAISQLPGSDAQDTARGVHARMEELKARFPDGLDYALAFDFAPNLEAPERATTPGYLLVDVVLPAGASPARTDKVLQRCEELLRNTPGVQHVLALTDQPFDGVRGRPSVLAQLSPATVGQPDRERFLKDIRSRLREQVPEGLLRLRDLSGPGRFPRRGYPVDLAVSGPDADQVRKLAKQLAERLNQGKQLTDVLANPDSMPQPQLHVVIDREKMHALGVSLQDINTTLQATVGLQITGDADRPGRSRPLQVQAGPISGNRAEDLRRLKVRTSQGEMVPLDSLAAVREIEAPLVLDRLNGHQMVEVTANPASGVALAQARTLCETTAEEVRKELHLSAEYRLTWLDPMPAAK